MQTAFVGLLLCRARTCRLDGLQWGRSCIQPVFTIEDRVRYVSWLWLAPVVTAASAESRAVAAEALYICLARATPFERKVPA